MKISLIIKFIIGFIAGLCAALLPRLSAEMVAGGSGALDLFNFNYLVASSVFALLIGAITAILEWESSRSPKDIFMAALAIPGIISGALNTTVSVSNFEEAEAAKQKMVKLLEEEFNIPTLPDTTPALPSEQTSLLSSPEILDLLFVNTAHAASQTSNKTSNYGVGIKKGERRYVVVLGQAKSKEKAAAKAEALRTIRKKTRILRYGEQNFLITTNSPKNKSDALIEAIRLKKRGLKPSLIEVK